MKQLLVVVTLFMFAFSTCGYCDCHPGNEAGEGSNCIDCCNVICCSLVLPNMQYVTTTPLIVFDTVIVRNVAYRNFLLREIKHPPKTVI